MRHNNKKHEGSENMINKTNRTPVNKEKDESYGLPGEDRGYDYEECR